MDIKALMSKLQSIESMNKITEAEDPAAVIQKYTDMGKSPTPDMPAFIDPKDGKVKYMDKGAGMGQQPQVKTMPSDWIKRYAPDLADALAAQGGNKQGYGQQQQGGLFGIKGLGNFDQGTKVNTQQAGADASSAKFKAGKLKQLNDLVAKLSAETKGGNTDPAVGKVDYSLAGGAPAGGPGIKLKESLLREFGLDEEGSAGGDPSTLTVYGKTGAQTDALTAAARANAGAPAGSAAQPAPAAAPAAAPAGGDTVSQLQAVMKELSDLGDDPEVAKALQSAQAAIDAAQKAKQSSAGGAKTGLGGGSGAVGGSQGQQSGGLGGAGNKGSAPVSPTATTQEKMDRFVFLMNKKKAAANNAATLSAATGAGGATPTNENYFINKLRLIESRQLISEVLTPEEEKELQALSKEVVGAASSGADGIPPEVLAAVKEFQAGGSTTAGPDAGKPAGSAPQPVKKPANPKLAPLTKLLGQIEGILKKATGPAPAAKPGAAPQPKPGAPAAKPGAAPQPKPGAPAAAPAAPAAAPAGNTTTSNSSVEGTLKMGKASGPITYNGKVVNPGDPQYAAAEQALIKASGQSKQYKGPALPAGSPNADFEESVNMTDAERYRALVNKLESINQPVKEEEKLDELVPAILGIGAVISALKGGSDYLDKLAASKKAVGNLKPEEITQLATFVNQLEELLADPTVAKAIEADKNLTKRVSDVSTKAKSLQDQAAMAGQSTAQTIGGTVGAAVKAPFRAVGNAVSSAATAVGDFFKGAGNAQ